jgi:hypothetical protein
MYEEVHMAFLRCSQATHRRSDSAVPVRRGSEPKRRTARRSAVQRSLDSGFTPQVLDDNSQAA